MKNVWRIFRVQMSGLLSINAIRCHTDEAARKKARKNLLMWVVLAVLCVVMSCSYSLMFSSALAPLGMMTLLPELMMVAASVLTLLSALMRVRGVLFGTADYDLLMSLPVRGSEVAGARLMSYYVVDSLFALCLLLPAGVIYAVNTQASWLFFPVYLIAVLLVPVLPLAVGGLFGTVIAALLARMRRRALLDTVFQLVLVLAIMAVSFSSNTAMTNLAGLAPMLETRLDSLYPLAGLFSDAVCRLDPMAILLFVGGSAAIGTAFCFAICLLYQRLNTLLSATYRDTRFRLTQQKGQSCMRALYRKEWKRLTGCAAYLINTGFGEVLMVLGAGYALIARAQVLPMWEMLEPMIGWALPLVVAWLVSLSVTTSAAVSLEGKQLWLMQQLPIPAAQWLSAKIYVGLTLSVPAVLLCGILLTAGYPFSGLHTVGLFAVPLCYSYFFTVFGLYLNLKKPKFDWQTEMECVKQGLPVLINMLLVFLAVGVPAALCVLLDSELYLWGAAVLLLAAGAVLRVFLKRRAEKMLMNLS